MTHAVKVTETDLRAAMRDPLYWDSTSLNWSKVSERTRFADWVGHGWKGLHSPGGAPRTSVWVRAYEREGLPVSAHWRGQPNHNSAIHLAQE